MELFVWFGVVIVVLILGIGVLDSLGAFTKR